MTTEPNTVRWWSWDLRRGALAGAIAGLGALAWNLLVAASAGGALWVAVKAAAYPLVGDAALAPGFAALPVILGAVGHLALAALCGAVFAVLVEPFHPRFYVWLGALWGLTTWAATYHVALRLLGATALERELQTPAVLTAHILFGVATGIVHRRLDVRDESERGRVVDVAAALSPPTRRR